MKIGLFFGSFNPIHNGHMMLADYILAYTEIEEIWFVVSPQNPFKNESELLSKEQRLHMVNLAIGDNNRLSASDIEFLMPVPSYTCDALKKLTTENPMLEFHLLLGTDTYDQLSTWKEAEYVKTFPQIVYPRFIDNGHKHTWGMSQMGNATYVKAPLIQVSSTFIRQAVSEGKHIKNFVPGPVWDYINLKGFYK